MEYLILFIFGASIGSFLNVCIYRLPRNKSIVKPASHCPECGEKIAVYDNIPVLGFILLKGKCRNCQQPISIRYIFVEIISALCTVYSYVIFEFSPQFIFYIVFIYFLIVIGFIDLELNLINNRLLIFLLVFGVIFNLLFRIIPWREALWGVFSGGISLSFFAILGKIIFRKESMGMGDIKLGAVLGFYLGWKYILLALFAGFIFAASTAFLLVIASKRKMPRYLPMAPFFLLGSLTFLFWGSKILNWYWNLFLPQKF